MVSIRENYIKYKKPVKSPNNIKKELYIKIYNEKSEDIIFSFTQKQIAGGNSKETQIWGQDDT